SRELSAEIESDSGELSAEIKSDIESIQLLIDKLDFKEPMMAEEYINVDDNVMTGGGLTDEEIVEMVCPSNKEFKEVNNEITVRPIVLVKEVLGDVSNAIEFLINPLEDFTSDVKMILELRKVQSQLWTYYMSKKKQSTID
ncbi:18514_t:CDS:1, partial [Acaulospora morrowiae]